MKKGQSQQVIINGRLQRPEREATNVIKSKISITLRDEIFTGLLSNKKMVELYEKVQTCFEKRQFVPFSFLTKYYGLVKQSRKAVRREKA